MTAPTLLVVTPIEAALMVFVLLTAVVTALARDVLAAIIVFGAYSLGMAVLYTFYRAPDVALTEAAVSAGITTVLLLLTIAKTSRIDHDASYDSVDPTALAVVALLGVAIASTLSSIPAVGDPTAAVWSNEAVTQYYIAQTYADTHVDNTVMAVLAGYRGFDTFGEAVVVFAAGVATMLVLRREAFT